MKKCKTGDMKQGRVNRTVWSKATYLEEASLQTTALGSERLGIEACIGSTQLVLESRKLCKTACIPGGSLLLL